jgi:hypothetical protein
MWIFPLLRRRWLFSGSEKFFLYDFYAGAQVDENVFAYSNRVGEQRALVLYHNRHDTTAGWIRESAAFAVKQNDDETALCRTTLGEALGFGGGAAVYVAFRDYTEGLEYLRSGRELQEKGLYAELGEYQFHVFMDFREIRDDGAGNWGKLCGALNGRGVENLEDELKQLHYASLNEAFRAVLDLVPETDAPAVLEKADDIQHAAQRFLAVLKAQLNGKGTLPTEALKGLADGLQFLAAIRTIKTASKEANAFLARLTGQLGSPAGMRLLLAWLLLRDTSTEPGRFGLDYTLRRVLTGPDSADAPRLVQLLEALLSCRAPVGSGRKKTAAATVDQLFSLPLCRNFMLVHESGGVEWFNKERFEELTLWLAVVNLADQAAQRPAGRTLAGWLAGAEKGLIHHAELAAHAGYRAVLFLTLLEPATKPGSNKTAGKKAVKKGKDEPKTAGSRMPKAPKGK